MLSVQVNFRFAMLENKYIGMPDTYAGRTGTARDKSLSAYAWLDRQTPDRCTTLVARRDQRDKINVIFQPVNV